MHFSLLSIFVISFSLFSVLSLGSLSWFSVLFSILGAYLGSMSWFPVLFPHLCSPSWFSVLILRLGTLSVFPVLFPCIRSPSWFSYLSSFPGHRATSRNPNPTTVAATRQRMRWVAATVAGLWFLDVALCPGKEDR